MRLKKNLVITRSPVRISFVGGGSDLPLFYKKFGGLTFNATINKYVYLFVNKFYDPNKCLLKYSNVELVKQLDQIKHPLIRESLRFSKTWGLDINSIADIGSGTGLGSSSAFTLSLLKSLYFLNGKSITKNNLAYTACKIEIEKAKSFIGKQDQYSSSFGGINKFTFNKNGSVTRKNFNSDKIKKFLSENILIADTGISKSNYKLMKNINSNLNNQKTLDHTNQIKELVEYFIDGAENGDIIKCSSIINKSWELKKKLSPNVSNNNLDKFYSEILSSGALGAKLLGAGGRGFFLIFAEKKNQKKLKKNFSKIKFLDFKFDFEGTKIIHSN